MSQVRGNSQREPNSNSGGLDRNPVSYYGSGDEQRYDARIEGFNRYPGQRNLAYEETGLTGKVEDPATVIQMNPPRKRNGKNSSKEKDSNTVVVLGSGDLGRALVSCLVRSKYNAVVVSRNVDRNRARVIAVGGTIESYEDGIPLSDTIILAIPYEGFSTLPQHLLEGKILIDVSNRPLKYDKSNPSLAVQLQNQLPKSRVVKAFNTLSAYTLQQGHIQGSKEIPICSDDDEAKLKVIDLARNLGFIPVDSGNLSNAKGVEDIPLTFFPEWKTPLIVGGITWIISLIYMSFRVSYQFCDQFASPNDFNGVAFGYFPIMNMHCAFAITTIVLLCSCYAPGVIAAYLQLYRGTKYSSFPNWLDNWLKCRKHLGLLALYCAPIHFILAINLPLVWGMIDFWRMSMVFFCGAITFSFMTVLGVASIPSVAASLTWREFSFVQRYLGWWCLFMATFHLIFVKWDWLVTDKLKCIFLPDEGKIIVIYLLVTIIAKLILLLPCIDNHLQKIRRGFERL